MSTGSNRDRDGLMRAYDEEEALGLADLAEDSDEEDDDPRSPMIGSFRHSNGGPANGNSTTTTTTSSTTQGGRLAPNGKKNAVHGDSIEMQNRKRSGER